MPKDEVTIIDGPFPDNEPGWSEVLDGKGKRVSITIEPFDASRTYAKGDACVFEDRVTWFFPDDNQEQFSTGLLPTLENGWFRPHGNLPAFDPFRRSLDE